MASANERIARSLIDAYDARTLLDPITAVEPEFDTEAAYDVLHIIERDRLARGWLPVGRKIGFTNRTIWELYGVSGPMWARVWDCTLHRAGSGGRVDLARTVRAAAHRTRSRVRARGSDPGVRRRPSSCWRAVEWMAAGFEIVQCHFPGWRFAAPDSTASFGLHGALVVGTPVAVTDENRASVAARSRRSSSRCVARTEPSSIAGMETNVLDSQPLALGFLARTVADAAAVLGAGGR